ncbi:MAG: hypothetical protein KDA90_08455 [Planctomycetaceae bacterium]|nr:hypothetical protein [Planctomycetaceae bacterium]
MIDERICYTLKEFKKQTGMGDVGVRGCFKAGLPSHHIGRQSFILGADWIAFVRGELKEPAKKK